MPVPGPNEQQLIQALRARRGVLQTQREGWHTGSQMASDAAAALRAARLKLDAEQQLGEETRAQMIAVLEGIDVQFKQLSSNMGIGVSALQTANGSVSSAEAAYAPIAGAAVPSSPTQAPYDPEWDQAQRTEADRQHSADVASHQQALQERENKCAQILTGLRGGMGESQVLWSQINDYHSDDQGRAPSSGPSSPTPGAVSSPGAGRNSAGVIDRAHWGEVVSDPPRTDVGIRPDDGGQVVVDGDDVGNGSLVPSPHPQPVGTLPGVLPPPSPGDTGLLGRGPDVTGGGGASISAGGGGGGLGAVAPAAGVAGGALGAAAVRGGAGLISAGGAGGAGAGGRAIGATNRAAGPGALGGRGGPTVAGGGGGAAGRGGAGGAGGRGAGAVGSRGGRGGMSGAMGAAGGAGGRGGRSGRQGADDRDHLLVDEDWIDDEATGPDVLR